MSPHLVFSDIVILVGVNCCFTVFMTSVFLVTEKVSVFLCLLVICTSSCKECLLQSCHFKVELFVFLLSYGSSLTLLDLDLYISDVYLQNEVYIFSILQVVFFLYMMF